jgi:hypothetical protein
VLTRSSHRSTRRRLVNDARAHAATAPDAFK